MYEILIGQTIDKSNADFDDFPDSLNGEKYLGGDMGGGWHTQPIVTPEQVLIKARIAQKAKIREDFITNAISAEVQAIDDAPDVAAVQAIGLII